MDRALMTAWTSVVGPDDTVLNGGDVALAGRLGECGRTRCRDRDAHGRHRSTARADAPPDGRGPARLGDLHGHVHDNEPLRTTPHINVCVEHAGYEPLALDAVLALAKRLLACDMPEGATTGERIRNAESAVVKRSEADANDRGRCRRGVE